MVGDHRRTLLSSSGWAPKFARNPTRGPSPSPGQWTTNGSTRAKKRKPGGSLAPQGPRLAPLVPLGVWQCVGTHPDAATALTGPVSGDFWALSGPSGSTSAPTGRPQAALSRKTAADGRQRGVGGPNLACGTALHKVSVYPGAGSFRAAMPEMQNRGPPALLCSTMGATP